NAGQSLEQARDGLVRVVEQMATKPIADEELDRAKREVAATYGSALGDSTSMANELSCCASYGDWRLFFLERDQIAKVTAADVQRVAGCYLRQNNRTVGMYVPTQAAERVAIPAAPSAAELLKDYRGRVVTVSGEAFEPTLENLEKRTQRGVLPG